MIPQPFLHPIFEKTTSSGSKRAYFLVPRNWPARSARPADAFLLSPAMYEATTSRTEVSSFFLLAVLLVAVFFAVVVLAGAFFAVEVLAVEVLVVVFLAVEVFVVVFLAAVVFLLEEAVEVVEPPRDLKDT